MNDREFDAYLRGALREPGPAQVPDHVRADEIARAVAIVADELLWGEVDLADDDGQDDVPRDDDLSAWDDARVGDQPDDYDDDIADDGVHLHDDPVLALEPLDHDVDHDADLGIDLGSTEGDPLGIDRPDLHDDHDPAPHPDDS